MNYGNFLDRLSQIRLATLLEQGKDGSTKALYKLEETDPAQDSLLDALDLREFHESRPRIPGVGVYK